MRKAQLENTFNKVKNNIPCDTCESAGCFIKRFCSESEKTVVELSKTASSWRKDDFIFREGDIVFGIYFIREGGVKVISDNLHGRQHIVRLSKSGNILGYRALGKTQFYFNAVALTDTSVCFIDNDLYHHLCRNNIELTYNLMLHYAHELGRTGLRMKFQSQMNMREKIAEAFVYIHEVFGLDPETGTFPVPVSRQEIADLAGTTAEQVSRQITEFEDEKLIERNKRDIRIPDITALSQIVSKYKIA